MLIHNVVEIRRPTRKNTPQRCKITYTKFIIICFLEDKKIKPVNKFSNLLVFCLIKKKKKHLQILVQINAINFMYFTFASFVDYNILSGPQKCTTLYMYTLIHATLIGFYPINFKLANFPVNLYVINFLMFLVDRWQRKLINSRMHTLPKLTLIPVTMGAGRGRMWRLILISAFGRN